MIALETKWGELETITITCHRWGGGGGEGVGRMGSWILGTLVV